MKLRLLSFILFSLMVSATVYSQSGKVKDVVKQKNGDPVPFANIYVSNSKAGTSSDVDGNYELKNLPTGQQTIIAQFIGFDRQVRKGEVKENETTKLNFDLKQGDQQLNEVVVTGTMKEISKKDSPVSVEVYAAKYFENKK